MPAVQNKDKWLLSVTYSLSLSGRSSLLWCLLSLEWEMTLKQKIVFCYSALPFWSAPLPAECWKHENSTHTHTNVYCVSVRTLLKCSWFHNTIKPTRSWDSNSSVCYLYSRGSDGDLVGRSEKVPLKCIIVRPWNLLCLEVLAPAQFTQSGPHSC